MVKLNIHIDIQTRNFLHRLFVKLQENKNINCKMYVVCIVFTLRPYKSIKFI